MIPASTGNTTRRERTTRVIEDPFSCEQSLSCELNQVLTLRLPAAGPAPGGINF
jgi:hypothetical protein